MPYESEKIKSRLFYYLCMVLVGCILANILLRCDQDLQSFVLSFTDSTQITESSVQQTVFRVLMQRIKQIVMIYLLYKVFSARTVYSFIMSAMLILLGFLISCQIFYFGIPGVCLFLLCLFPHYLIYGWILYYMATKIQKGYEGGKHKQMVIFVLGVAFLAGILSESVLSKIFLKNFLQYMGMQ